MEFVHCSLADIERARGTVVVIDVLRAFTTAAFAFERGAKKILPVSTVDEAFRMRERDPTCLLMGEINALPVPGFDLPNSPHIVGQAELEGCTIIHRSTAGTQGIVPHHVARIASDHASNIVVAGRAPGVIQHRFARATMT